ncbi:hypothetical protein FAZ19_02045 [Sphingobacterium alkalisoli]|uniref:Uncharacterized protein n=1 Tax=Sphingobacterium alkalisoli TaxID=1874115 RepID=A0A4U0H859_9SPHI|nr:hypothetical protein [Sphingobacterium alkalisoli]TJY68065.1 hypothetical protein FAZ19_02045 [Sphingobacterium alkalisoli]GGH09292.1 hypothetical protein GCM10011418_07230 [Sphingobacterium alkalisoli]
MKSILFVVVFTLTSLTACEKSSSQIQNADEKNLTALRSKISAIVDTASCIHSENWNFTPIGSKACGGPKGYIAYPNTIDTDAFLKLVQEYNKAEQDYNRKYDIASDCMYVMPPKEVTCENGKPVLAYEGGQM